MLSVITLIAFLGGILSGATGVFGGTLTLIGLTMVLPIEDALLMSFCVSLMSNSLRILVYRRGLKIGNYKKYFLGILLSIPCFYFVPSINSIAVQIFLLISILVFLLLPEQINRLPMIKSNFVMGFLTSLISGIYGFRGPLVILSLLKERSSKESFIANKALLQLMVVFAGLIGLGLRDYQTSLGLFEICIALMCLIPGIYIGKYFNGKISQERFGLIIKISLIATFLTSFLAQAYLN